VCSVRSRRTRPRHGFSMHSGSRSSSRSARRVGGRASALGGWACDRRGSRSTSTRSCSSVTLTRRVPARTARAASASTRCTASSTKRVSISPVSCGPATRARTPPPTTLRCSTPRSRSSRSSCTRRGGSGGSRSSPGPPRPARRTSSRPPCARGIGFSLGYYVDERVGQAAVALPKRRWRRALNADGSPRRGAWVAELSACVDLSAWPAGTRLIVRRERPHPGAQRRFTDSDGHRSTCFLTDHDGNEIAQLERRHRLHARVEDRIQESQELGLGRLPFQALQPNRGWFELALLAQDLLAWLRLLVLE